MSRFSEEELLSHMTASNKRLFDPFAELVDCYKRLAVETIKTRSTMQGEVERKNMAYLKQVQDDFCERLKSYESESKRLQEEKKFEESKAKEISSLNDKLVAAALLKKSELASVASQVGFLQNELEKERALRTDTEDKLVKIQSDNDMLLLKLKDENIRKMEFFNEYLEKEETLKKEKEDLKREKEVVFQKLKVLRGYIAQLTSNSGNTGYLVSLI